MHNYVSNGEGLHFAASLSYYGNCLCFPKYLAARKLHGSYNHLSFCFFVLLVVSLPLGSSMNARAFIFQYFNIQVLKTFHILEPISSPK